MENKFSIVMPVYNAEEYLQRSLSHVEALPQDEFEILFVDDGSIDQSASILEAYCNAHANARFIKSAHRGVSAARNAGIAAAEAFRKRQITLSQALERTGIKKSAFYYHLKKLTELGLISA